MDSGGWWTTVHWVANSWPWIKRLNTQGDMIGFVWYLGEEKSVYFFLHLLECRKVMLCWERRRRKWVLDQISVGEYLYWLYSQYLKSENTSIAQDLRVAKFGTYVNGILINKNNELLIDITKWINLKIILLSERNLREKGAYYMQTYLYAKKIISQVSWKWSWKQAQLKKGMMSLGGDGNAVSWYGDGFIDV